MTTIFDKAKKVLKEPKVEVDTFIADNKENLSRLRRKLSTIDEEVGDTESVPNPVLPLDGINDHRDQ